MTKFRRNLNWPFFSDYIFSNNPSCDLLFPAINATQSPHFCPADPISLVKFDLMKCPCFELEKSLSSMNVLVLPLSMSSE